MSGGVTPFKIIHDENAYLPSNQSVHKRGLGVLQPRIKEKGVSFNVNSTPDVAKGLKIQGQTSGKRKALSALSGSTLNARGGQSTIKQSSTIFEANPVKIAATPAMKIHPDEDSEESATHITAEEMVCSGITDKEEVLRALDAMDRLAADKEILAIQEQQRLSREAESSRDDDYVWVQPDDDQRMSELMIFDDSDLILPSDI